MFSWEKLFFKFAVLCAFLGRSFLYWMRCRVWSWENYRDSKHFASEILACGEDSFSEARDHVEKESGENEVRKGLREGREIFAVDVPCKSIWSFPHEIEVRCTLSLVSVVSCLKTAVTSHLEARCPKSIGIHLARVLQSWQFSWWLNGHWLLLLSLSRARLFATPWPAARPGFHPPRSPGVCSYSCPLSQWCRPTISSSVVPFFCPQSFPASESFPMGRLFASGGQSFGASSSVSVLLMNI